MILLTKDISSDFFPALQAVAEALESDAMSMMAVMFSESGCRADAHNNGPAGADDAHQYHASGLIQFMPATLPGVGWLKGHAEFRKLTATQQLPYVQKYYTPYIGHLGNVGGLYTATFLPALIKHAGDSDFVLTAKNGPLGWAYAPNASFDKNHDLAITVGELEDAVIRNCTGPRWGQLVARLTGDELNTVEADKGLDTIFGLQLALFKLGYDPGPVDGVVGPKTRSAVAAFQRANKLDPDGVYGPLTRAALEEALKFHK